MTDTEKKLLETCVDYLHVGQTKEIIRETLMTMYETGVLAGKIEGLEKALEISKSK